MRCKSVVVLEVKSNSTCELNNVNKSFQPNWEYQTQSLNEDL
jgi:hypothetical protein